jgi:GNAT superfamily N-acetyltransferase
MAGAEKSDFNFPGADTPWRALRRLDCGSLFPAAMRAAQLSKPTRGDRVSGNGSPETGRVRLARAQEIDRVAALWTGITQHHAVLDPLFRMRRGPVADSELRELLRTLQRDPDAAILVYDLEGTLEGLCIVRIDHAAPILEETERAEITDLGVRPALRRRGIATRLVEEAQAWVTDRGVARIEIQVAHGNREGQAFWRARGFEDFMDVLHKRV